MNIAVKICGLSTPETIEAALAVGADMLGFVRFEKSPRHLSLETTRRLGGLVGGRARKVLLTVDADDVALAAAIEALTPDILQLHGAETPQRVIALKARFGLPVMKAIAIGKPADLAQIAVYESVADLLLLDSRATDSVLPGGTGTAFDWTLLKGLKLRKPWLLAGGLTTENVGAALTVTQAPGVDASSGVERAPGIKDAAKIVAFVAAARPGAEKLGSKVESS
jgi:phosphoribosylanthranilate isomerase